MSYCETVDEIRCLDNLKAKFPSVAVFMLDIMAWVYINKPERFEEIMAEHQNNMADVMIELQDFDYKSIMRKPEE